MQQRKLKVSRIVVYLQSAAGSLIFLCACARSNLKLYAQEWQQCSVHKLQRNTVQVRNLSREDGEHLTDQDFTKGSLLMWEYKGKDYPVTFVNWKGMQLYTVIVVYMH